MHANAICYIYDSQLGGATNWIYEDSCHVYVENSDRSPDWHKSWAGGEGGMFSTLRRLSTVSRKARTRKKVFILLKFNKISAPLLFLKYSSITSLSFSSNLGKKKLWAAAGARPRPPWHRVDRGAGVGHGHQRLCQVSKPFFPSLVRFKSTITDLSVIVLCISAVDNFFWYIAHFFPSPHIPPKNAPPT